MGMNSGLDYNMMKRIKKHSGFNWISFSIKGMVAVDIKGQGNITGFDCYRANMRSVDSSIFDTIPEFKQIKKL